jgi:hypothetical protein
MLNESKIQRDTELRLLAQRAHATVEISDPAQRLVQQLAAELLDTRAELRALAIQAHGWGGPEPEASIHTERCLMFLDGRLDAVGGSTYGE